MDFGNGESSQQRQILGKHPGYSEMEKPGWERIQAGIRAVWAAGHTAIPSCSSQTRQKRFIRVEFPTSWSIPRSPAWPGRFVPAQGRNSTPSSPNPAVPAAKNQHRPVLGILSKIYWWEAEGATGTGRNSRLRRIPALSVLLPPERAAWGANTKPDDAAGL